MNAKNRKPAPSAQDATVSTLSITTQGGRRFQFSPVAMKHGFPSDSPELWLQFQGRHTGDALSENTIQAIAAFMRANGTEALTDGKSFYTIAGDGLAYCNPGAMNT